MTTSTTSLTKHTPRQVRLLTALLLFATFLLGAATGAGFAHWRASPPPHLPPVPFLPGPSDPLHLTPDQEAQARAIMDKYRPKLEAVWREAFPSFRPSTGKWRMRCASCSRPSRSAPLMILKRAVLHCPTVLPRHGLWTARWVPPGPPPSEPVCRRREPCLE